MPTFEFTLIFKLPDGAKTPEAYLDALHKAGCYDALIGVGRPGYIALDFDQEAPTAEIAVATVIDHVHGAIPGIVLMEVRPNITSSRLP